MSGSVKENLAGMFKRAAAKRVVAGAGAVAAVGVVAALALGTAVAAEGLNVNDASYPAGTTAVADASTMDNYKLFPTNSQSTSYDTTQYAGRLWTDKTVTVPTSDNQTVGTTATFNFADATHDLDPTDSVAAGKYEVDKTASGTFLTSISLLSSSLTVSSKPTPLDIVLVLDVSGSMNYSFGGTQDYYPVYNNNLETSQIQTWGTGNGYNNNIYYQSGTDTNGDPIYSRVYRRNNAWRISDNNNATALTPRTSGTDTNTSHTQFYQYRQPTRMDALKDAVNGFVDTIANVNGQLPVDLQNRISIVKFASNQSSTDGNTLYDSSNHYNHSQVFTRLATYTNENKDAIEDQVFLNLSAGGATRADYGMNLAQNVLNGANRPEAQRVIIFFTDGEPTSGNSFENSVANSAITTSRTLKNNTTSPSIVYSIGIFDGASNATPGNNTSNPNRFMHAVSSNYPNAAAYNNLGTRAANSEYYLTAAGGGLTEVFANIATQITSSGGQDSTSTGRDGNTAVTITDYLGDYMEFKGLDGILYGTTADTTKFYAPGTQGAYHEQAQVQRDDASATQSTYTMWPKDLVPSALLNPEAGQENVSLNGITVKVTRSTDPKTGDTVTITVPPELIPSLRYSVDQTVNSLAGTSDTTSTRQDADPLRIFYSVGPKASTLSGVISQLEDQSLRSESATNESDRQSAAFTSFMASAAADGKDGVYKLYNNTKTTGAQGTATVNMTLSDNNPYYYYVDEPLYVLVSGSGDTGVYRKATSADASATKYVRTRYWTVGSNPTETNHYAAWSGASGTYDSSLYTDNGDGTYAAVTSAPAEGTKLYRKFTSGETDTYVEYAGAFADFSADTTLYIPNGTPRTDAAVTNVSIPKVADGNATSTATTSLVSTYGGGTTATQYLGNNGMLSIPVLGTLAVTKNIKAGDGFDLPTDPVPSATFTLNLKSAAGAALTEANTYRALIRDAAGHPIDPTTHAQVSSADSAKFYVVDGSTFELRDGETIKVTNLPDKATYTVTEAGQAGYQATVTDNTGVKQEPAERGASASTLPAATSGTGSGD